MTLYLLQFNNYFNREVKKFDDIDSYVAAASNVLIINDYDFNPADGVDTSATVGGEDYDFKSSNYLIVFDGRHIVSRWFILDADRQRYGQYKLRLHRDVIVDSWDVIKDKPLYIERAILPDSSKFIFNKEGVSVNQIKTSEKLLKDETKCAWICGYYAPNFQPNSESENPGQIPVERDVISDFSYQTLSAFQEAKGISFNTYYGKIAYLDIYFGLSYTENGFDLNAVVKGTITFGDENSIVFNDVTLTSDGIRFLHSVPNAIDFKISESKSSFISRLNSNSNFKSSIISSALGTTTWNETKLNSVLELNNKILNTIQDSFYYKIKTTRYIDNKYYNFDYFVSNQIRTYFSSYISFPGNAYVNQTATKAIVEATSLGSGNTTITMPSPANRIHLKDSPYDMFCIPCGIPYEDSNGEIKNSTVNVTNSLVSGFGTVSLNKIDSISLAQNIAKNSGSGCYDVQLLPYCPLTGIEVTGTEENITIDIKNSDVRRFTKTADGKGVIIWSASSSGTKNISVDIPIDNVKMDVESKIWRLSSPNYNGQFEFNAAKNGGVQFFNVDYTYLPGSPYIHVNPSFDLLYGKDFNDSRGLICQGDFSISILSDEWVNYQIQNKNYENTFKRDIQNMETNYGLNRNQQLTSGVIDSLTTGLQVGALVGGKAGVVAGVGAAALSAAGTAQDLYYNQKLYEESVSYASDKYNLSLGNVQALPQSISKTTAYTENNKVFPLIEFYTCTEEEKTAIANKIRYEGMTVGAVGTIEQFINVSWEYNGIQDKGFIRGKFYQLPVNDDFHFASAVEKEIEKGIYTKWE